MKCQPKANNNRKAVVVCPRHIVKRNIKRMRASIHVYVMSILSNSQFYKINIQNVDFGKSHTNLTLIFKIADFIKSTYFIR